MAVSSSSSWCIRVKPGQEAHVTRHVLQFHNFSPPFLLHLHMMEYRSRLPSVSNSFIQPCRFAAANGTVPCVVHYFTRRCVQMWRHDGHAFANRLFIYSPPSRYLLMIKKCVAGTAQLSVAKSQCWRAVNEAHIRHGCTTKAHIANSETKHQ